MKPITIAIEEREDYPLSLNEIKYTFRTLLTIAGLPWLFAPQNAEQAVDIYFGRAPCRGKLFVEMASVDRNALRAPQGVVSEDGGLFFLFDGGQRRKDIALEDARGLQIWNDIVLSSFWLLAGCEERFIPRDRNDSHQIQESFLYQNHLLHHPLVNHYSLIIKNVFAQTHNPLPLWPDNKRYAVALSHDVDYPEMIKWIEALRYLARCRQRSKISKVLDILRGRESFWRFEDWVALEQQYNMKSTFYFCGFQGNLLRYFVVAPDPFYDIRQQKFRKIIEWLDRNGFEVGMHSSYTAYRSLDQFRAEKQILEEVRGKPILGNRHHYWHVHPENPAETALLHSSLGLWYDSSLIFERHSGFRRGVCAPFYPYDRVGGRAIPVLQLPPVLMDDQLYGHIGYTEARNYQKEVDSLLNAVRKFHGMLIVDYHVRVFNDTFFPRWTDSYRYLLDSINRDDDFYCETLINVAKWWKEREEKILKDTL